MIKIKFIPDILKNAGREERDLPYSRLKTIIEYIRDAGYQEKDIKVIVSGRVVDNLDVPVDNEDEIIVTPAIKDPISIGITVGSLLAMGGAAWGAASAVWSVLGVIGTIMVIGGSIGSFFTKPRQPSFGFGNGLDESSPTYGWDGIRSLQDVGASIPVVYGTHKIGGNVLNAWVRNDGDKNYLNVLLGLGEGEIESIDDIKINNNPISNFDNVTTTTKLGTNAQTVIPNFEDAHNLYTVNVQLTKDNPHVYTTADSDVEGFEILLTLPGGIYQADNNGSINAWSVTYQVEYKTVAAPSYTDLGTTTITAKSRSAVRRVYRKIGLSADQYMIRVTRTSDDPTLDPVKAGDLTWSQIDEIKTDDFAYPNVALLGIEALASDQLSGAMPNFTCVVEGIKVLAPQVMNGAAQVDWADYYWNDDEEEFRLLDGDTSLTWDGSTYVAQHCANPYWCMQDLMINDRYGLGNYISSLNIDTDLLLEMAKYAEEKVPNGDGGYEKRFYFDVVIDSRTRALDLIHQLCSSFQCMPFYSEGTIKLRAEKNDSATQLFGMGNIIKDSFTQHWKSIKEVPNIITVQYLNADNDYEQETITYVDDDSLAAGDPIRQKDVRYFTTRTSQAIRLARYALKHARLINRMGSFKASIEAVSCQPGDVISLSHDVPQWGFSGRVKTGSTTTLVKLDREVTIAPATTYKIRVKFADDSIEERTVSDGAGTYTEVNVSSAFSQAPAAYDGYAFGEQNIVKKDVRVLSLQRDSIDEVSMSWIEVDTNVYDDSDVDLPTTKYSALDTVLKDVDGLALTEGLVKVKDGTYRQAINVWFQKPEYSSNQGLEVYSHSEIWLSDDSGSHYTKVGETAAEHFAIIHDLLRNDWTYYVKVVAVGKYTRQSLSAAPEENITLTGGADDPPDVSNLEIFGQGNDTYFRGRDVKFRWVRRSHNGAGDIPAGDGAGDGYRDVEFKDFEVQILVAGVVVRQEFVTDNWYDYTWEKNAQDGNGVASATLTIRVWQRNFYNRRSDSYAELSVTNPTPKQPTSITSNFDGRDLVVGWNPRPSCDIDFRRYKIVVTGSGGERTYYRDATSFFYSFDENVDQHGGNGDRSLTVDIYSEDWFGQLSSAATISPINTAPSAPTVTVTPFFNQVMLQWDDVGDTDLKYYEIWQSTTGAWAGEEELISKVAGTLAILKVDADDETLYFKVRGVDTFGAGSFCSSKEAEFVSIDADDVTITGALITLSAQIANAIIQDAHIANLSAGKINTGTLTGITIQGNTIQTSASGSRIVLDANALTAYDDAGGVVVKIELTGANVGDVTFGNAASDYMKWDKSAGKLIVAGIQSPDYVQYDTGFKLTATGGLEIWSGDIKPNLGGGFIGQFSIGDGSDGTVVISSNTTLTNQIKQYENLTINNGVTLTLENSIIFVRRRLTVIGTISADGKGYSGAAGVGGYNSGSEGGGLDSFIIDEDNADEFGFHGGGSGGGGGGTNSGDGGPGGQATSAPGEGGEGGGTGNIDGGDGDAGSFPGQFASFLDIYKLLKSMGAGGGSGGSYTGVGYTSGAGGDGGGVIIIMCGELDFQSGAVLTADGEDGGDESGAGGSSCEGGGGGGGGGLVFVQYKTLVANAGTTSVTGGAGGDGYVGSGYGITSNDGGAGGAGQAIIRQFPN